MLNNYLYIALQNGLQEWHTIFWIGASVYIASGIIFIVFGTGETQPWNNAEKEEERKDEKGLEGVENPAFESAENTKV